MISLAEYRNVIGNFDLKCKGIKFKYRDKDNSTKGGKSRNRYSSKGIIFMIFMVITVQMVEEVQCKGNNKHNHMVYGNKGGGGKNLNILHWNKGPSFLQNKVNDLDYILETYRPDILTLCEANLLLDRDNGDIGFLNSYNYETTDQRVNYNISRQLILINKQLNYKRRADLEGKYDCCIWLEIKLKNQGSILVMGGYRQWALGKELDKNGNSKSIKAQLERYKSIALNIEKAIGENKDTIICMDDNFDDLEGNKYTNKYNAKNGLQKLLDIRQNIMNNCNLVIHNKKATFFKLDSQSRIDHIYSNCMGKILNLRTIITGMSDHCLINFTYRTKNVNIKPKFAFQRDKYLLTSHELGNYVDHNFELNTIFHSHDPNVIAETIIRELNLIINIIAPKKRVQLRNNFAPYINKELMGEIR